MSNIRTEFGFQRTECACENCVQFCVSLPGYLIPTDLEVISTQLGYDDVIRFAVENLMASPGALVCADGTLKQIRTLVPNRTRDGACKFLRDNRCAIHAQAPFACAFFHDGQDRHEADFRSFCGLRAIAHEWATGGLYARLWVHLYSLGLIAPSPIKARERMRWIAQQKKNRAS
jgi:Fe-S-cluster containining protein